ncbi:MAG: hypothetical protein WDM81_16540 [Rhizomicrobium sp.]
MKFDVSWRRARRGVRHDQFEMAFGAAGHGFEFLRLAAKRLDRLLHRGALARQCVLEGGAFILQALHQFVHAGAVALLAAEHEFGARHGGVGDGFDALGLAVEFDGGGVRARRRRRRRRRGSWLLARRAWCRRS